MSLDNREGLGLSLVKGKESVLCLKSPGEPFGLCARLFYNRTYRVDENGSYTAPLHPDYSLAVFPDYCADETDAMEREKVLLLHFDAKYRVDRLPSLAGLTDEDGIGPETRTFKKTDLYKMHTYMDAIRRSAGSYIFYPGEPESQPSGKEPPYRKYAELFPGVGAFSLRPREGNWEDQDGALALGEFLAESVKVHRNRFRRYFRQMKATRENWRDSSPQEVQAIEDIFPAALFREKPPKDTRVLVGFVPSDLRPFLDAERLFYFWATDRDGRPFNVDREVFLADYFLPFFESGRGVFETSVQLYSILPLAPGQVHEAVSKDEISHARYPSYPEARVHRVGYYYQLSLGNVEGGMPRMVYPFSPDSPGRGFLPRVVDFEVLAQWTRTDRP